MKRVATCSSPSTPLDEWQIRMTDTTHHRHRTSTIMTTRWMIVTKVDVDVREFNSLQRLIDAAMVVRCIGWGENEKFLPSSYTITRIEHRGVCVAVCSVEYIRVCGVLVVRCVCWCVSDSPCCCSIRGLGGNHSGAAAAAGGAKQRGLGSWTRERKKSECVLYVRLTMRVRAKAAAGAGRRRPSVRAGRR